MKMILKFDQESTAGDLSGDFNSFFPYLKLGFFKHAHASSEPSKKKEMISDALPVGKFAKINKAGFVELTPSMTVAELEALMQDKFGMNIHVFRKSGRVWLETTTTDHLTLGNQNDLGKEKSMPVAKEDLTDIDYD